VTLWAALGLALLRASVVVAQNPAAFVVASVKLNTSGAPGGQLNESPDGLVLVNQRLRDILLLAYGVYDYQLTAPQWTSRDRFDISARADRPLSMDEKRARLRQLLADRFGLKVHNETREQNTYVLKLASGQQAPGAGLQPRDCAAPGAFNLRCGGGLMSPDGGIARVGGLQMPRLVAFLSQVLSRAVIDETGLQGAFDLDLQWRPDVGISPQITDDAKARIAERPALPAALHEQLGLELQARRGSVGMLVVDSIAQPTPD
jgi:uncharacterized protein (TIGR03435 family)